MKMAYEVPHFEALELEIILECVCTTLHCWLFPSAGGQGSVNVPNGETDDIDQILREIESTSISGGKKTQNKSSKPTPGNISGSNKPAIVIVIEISRNLSIQLEYLLINLKGFENNVYHK